MTDSWDDLMTECRMFQSEINGLVSLSLQMPSLDIGSLTGNKLAKDIHERQYRLKKEMMEKLEFEKLDLTETLNLKLEQLNKTVLDKLDRIEQNTDEKVEKFQNGLRDTVEKMKQEQEKSMKMVLDEIRLLRSEMDPKPSIQNVKSPEAPFKTNIPPRITPPPKKEITMSATFHNISELQKYDFPQMELFKVEEHFGVPFGILIFRRSGYVSFVMYVTTLGHGGRKTLEGECEIKLKKLRNGHQFVAKKGISMASCNYYWYWDCFMSWELMRKEYMVNGNVTLDVRLKIDDWNGITGKGEGRRKFDEKVQGSWDTVLVVKEKKFHVSNRIIVSQSTYFNSLLSDSNDNSEIRIDDVDSGDFQLFLEVLYGDPIGENTVEITLLLAEQFDSKVVTHRCEEFLIRSSRMVLKKKLQLATRYKLEKLKNHCIASIKSTSDVRSMIPQDLMDMDHSMLAALLEKTLNMGHW